MSRLYISHVSPAVMALKAAVDGNVELFDAIVATGQVKVAELAEFRSHADQHIHDTLYLLYEVVRIGNVGFLQRLIEEYGLSVHVHKERCALLDEQAATREARITHHGSSFTIEGSEALVHLQKMTPYRTDTLLEYAESLIVDCDKKLQDLIQKKRNNTKHLNAAIQTIAGRRIDPAKFKVYTERATTHMHRALDQWTLGQGIKQSGPRKIPLYEAEIKRLWAVKQQTALNEETAQIKLYRDKLRACARYIATQTQPQMA